MEVLYDFEVRDMGYWIWFEGSGDSVRWNVVPDEEKIDRINFADTIWVKLSSLHYQRLGCQRKAPIQTPDFHKGT